jgi:hypothetical protein
MSLDDRYIDLKGREFSLAELDEDERTLLKSLEQRADHAPPWHEFANFWMKPVGELYLPWPRPIPVSGTAHGALPHCRGSSQPARSRARRCTCAGLPRRDRDARSHPVQDAPRVLRSHGLSEDMLSHVLAGRKHIAIDTLSDALSRIGCALKIVPQTGPKRPRRDPRAAA